MERPTCNTCAYWSGRPDSSDGGCRRKSPNSFHEAASMIETELPMAFWPVTDFDDWCGEHSEWYKWMMELQARAVEQARQEKSACKLASDSSVDPGTTNSAS
jgi:hypothetical protein